MPAAVKLRDDFSAQELRALARRAKDVNQSRRLLSLAAVRDGKDRAEAAQIGGMDRQTLRMFTAPVTRVIEHRRRRPGAAEGRIVADIDPTAPGVGLALGQHGNRRASRPRGFHPRPLPEPGVRLSPHPAPIRPARRLRQVASARTIVGYRARSFRGKPGRGPIDGGSA